MVSPSDLSGKRILVTGASGFTGRYVVAELKAQGCHAVGLGTHPATEDGWARGLAIADAYLQADLRDRGQVSEVIGAVQPDIVVHLAALAFVGHGEPNDFYEVNLMGTRNLLDALAAAKAPVGRVLLASSANVYGNSDRELLDESTLPAPANDYAVSKLAMEYMASLWRDRLPIAMTRPFNYTGVGQAGNFLVPKIVDHFRRRAPVIELGNLDVWRDFSDVRFVAKSYAALAVHPDAVGATLNVCSGVTHSLREIIGLCAEITGHDIEVRVNPDFVRANEVKSLRGDDTRLRRLVGGLENPPLRTTLEWMLAA